MTDIDHRYTEDVVCPWCGAVSDFDPVEFEDGEEIECDECGKGFLLSVYYDPVISTEKLFSTEDKNCPYGLIAEGQFNVYPGWARNRHALKQELGVMLTHWKGKDSEWAGAGYFTWNVFPWGDEEDE